MSYFTPDPLAFLFQQDIFFAFIILFLWFVCNKEKPTRYRTRAPIGPSFPHTRSCLCHLNFDSAPSVKN